MKVCDRCGALNPDGLRFCQDCGNRLDHARAVADPPALLERRSPHPVRTRPPAPAFDFGQRPPQMSCASCGNQNPADARFCAECGAALIDFGAARPQEPAPTTVNFGSEAGLQALASLVGGAEPVAPEPARSVQISALNTASSAAAFAAPQTLAPRAPAAAAATSSPINEPRIACWRCGGRNEATRSACQFCGARLEPTGSSGLLTPPPQAAHVPLGSAAVAQAEPAAARFRLVVITQDGSRGREYALSESTTDVGREEGQILLPHDRFVSPRHARFTLRDGRWSIRDLGSTNRVYLRIRHPELLYHGDLILLGLEVLRFELSMDGEHGHGPAVDQGTLVFGSPIAPRWARLVQRTEEGVGRDVFHLGRDSTVIGRESGDLVFTADPFMSRRHAQLTRTPEDGSFVLSDLESSNGTYLAIRGEVPLELGDFVRIGQHLFRLDAGGGT